MTPRSNIKKEVYVHEKWKFNLYISSADIIALLNRVMATMTSTEEDETLQVHKAIFYDKPWDIQPFKPNAYWFLKTGELLE